jgi:hypothetical protein
VPRLLLSSQLQPKLQDVTTFCEVFAFEIWSGSGSCQAESLVSKLFASNATDKTTTLTTTVLTSHARVFISFLMYVFAEETAVRQLTDRPSVQNQAQ